MDSGDAGVLAIAREGLGCGNEAGVFVGGRSNNGHNKDGMIMALNAQSFISS
jgi:hypothetical protein